MRTIYSIAISFFFLVVYMVLAPNQADAVACQNKTVILYGNGMFRDKISAIRDSEELRDGLRQYYPAAQNTKEFEFFRAYASDSSGKVNSIGLNALEQLLEEGVQLFGDKFTDLFWKALEAVGKKGVSKNINQPLPQTQFDILVNETLPDAPPAAFRNAMKRISESIDEWAYMSDQDLNRMLDLYRTYLWQGKRIVVVAHSQGNFYANKIYKILTDPTQVVAPDALTGNPALAASVGVVAVASPAKDVPGGKLGLNEPNISVKEDWIISGLRAVFPAGSVLPSKPEGVDSWSQNWTDLTNISSLYAASVWARSWLGHSFVGWYLQGQYTHDFIMNGIVQTIEGMNGVGGLQYPKQCIQWPPVQTPTSWQKVLTHDWNTVSRGRGVYSRRIRDDANELMFNANYNWSTGIVNVRVASFDDSVNATLPPYNISLYAPQLPPTCNPYLHSHAIMGLVPVPKGVGVLIGSTSQSGAQCSAVGYGAPIVDSYITLVTHVWDNVSQSWMTSSSTLDLPRYVVYSDAGGPVLMTSYYSGGDGVIQIDTYKSWALYVGAQSPTGGYNYSILTVDNGALSLSANATNYQYPTTFVPVPVGRYSLMQSISSLPSLYVFGSATTVSPTPRVDSGRRIDQLVIGGSDTYIVGNGVQSAPDYYQYKLLAAWDITYNNAPLYNKNGVVHPTKMTQNRDVGNGAVATTQEEMMFFQW